jgi:nucleoside-diphosphate-sugar epimerase
MAPASALVTGASGFVGSHLVARLLADGARVSALVRPSSVLPPEWRDRVEIIVCDDFSESRLRQVCRTRFETVFHLAAYGVLPGDRDSEAMLRVNVALPAALARLCGEWGARLIMAGSSAEYRRPRTNEPISEGAPLEQGKLYGSSKAAGGLMASAIASESGTGFRLLRLFKAYGAGEAPHRLLPALVKDLSRGQPVALSAGTQIMDFVHIDDIVEALIRADAHCRGKGGAATWNVATGRGHSVREFAESVARAMQADASLLGFGAIAMRKDDEPWLVGAPDLLRGELGWQPATELDAGIRAAVAALVSPGARRSEGT